MEIEQTGAVLTQVGASKQLSAVAYDAQGHVVDAQIAWRSNTPAEIAVDGAGKITAQVPSGSAQIVAEAGGVRSAPLLAVATALPAGAVALTDAQIVGDPVETDPNAAPSLANTYQVVLRGVAEPALGTLLINTESKPVGGRVVAVQTAGGQSTVTLQLVSLREMFPSLNIRQTLDLSRAAVTIPPELEAKYDIARSGDTYTFTPRPGAFGVAGARERALAAAGTHALPPFTSCETSFSTLPIALSAPPLFSVTINPSLDLLYTAANGLERFVVQAEPVFKVEGGLNVTAAFEGKIDCKLELFVLRVPVGGPLSLVVGGLVPIGAGIEAGGKVTVATMGIGSKVEAKAKAQIGLACPGGSGCEFVRSLADTALQYTPSVDLPGIGDVRVEPTVMAYGYIKAEIGNPFLRRIRFEAFSARAGGKFAGSFAPMIGQIIDTGYKSDYKVSLEATAGVGADLEGAIRLLGLSSVSVLELTISTDLGRSPVGALSADKATFQAGENVNFSVRFDPTRKDFFAGIGPYNIRRVLLVRRNGLQATVVGTAEPATAGQTQFTLPFAATDFGSASEFTAFVVTTLLPLEALALKLDTAQSLRISGALPEQILQGVADFAVTVETSNGSAYQPAPGLLVNLAPSCGSVAPASGRTDPAGRLASRIDVTGCSGLVSVVVQVRADEGTPLLAQATLNTVAGFVFGDNIRLDSQAIIAAFNASGITRVVGHLDIELDDDPDEPGGETALSAVLPALVAVGGNVSIQGPLTALSMPALTEVGGNLHIDRIATPVTASFSALRQLGGELYVTRNTGLGSMNFGQLQALNGLFVTNNTGLGSAAFLQLEVVGNDGLFVTDNVGLTSVSFPQLVSVLQAHGGVFVTDNESLGSLQIGPVLAEGLYIQGNAALSYLQIGAANLVGQPGVGGLFIQENAVLSNLANVSCEIVSPRGVFITDNPAMPESEVERIVDCIRD
ncbi:MAG: hypothetical protein LKCHEGNO_00441 [Burkholderiaceae bacterium]|nr:hypothetical protein [Burkholderiaceae bacterium]